MFGQLVAHDITADRSPLTHHGELAEIRNARSPRANLEPVYSDGPIGMPFCTTATTAKLMVGRSDAGRSADLPAALRAWPWSATPQRRPPADEPAALAMLHLRNGLVDRLRSDGVAEAELFAEARRAATWHYQWVLLQDFLPRLVEAELAGGLLAGGVEHYARPGATWISRWSSPTPPTATATTRSATATRSTATPSRCCCPTCWASASPRRSWQSTGRSCSTCRSGYRPSGPSGSTAARRSLIELRQPSPGVGGGDTSLAIATSSAARESNCRRGRRWPRRLELEPLTLEEVGLGPAGWRLEAPLWFYLLKEAGHRAGGQRLGPVGARLVGEVLVGIVDADGEVRAVDPLLAPYPPRRPGRPVRPGRPARLQRPGRRRGSLMRSSSCLVVGLEWLAAVQHGPQHVDAPAGQGGEEAMVAFALAPLAGLEGAAVPGLCSEQNADW